MKIRVIILIMMLTCGKAFSTGLQNQADDQLNTYLKDSLVKITGRVAKVLGPQHLKGPEDVHQKGPRYMELRADVLDSTTTMKGWEGVKVTLYKYHVYDTFRKKTFVSKVYLCDASNERIARWVITACWLSKHNCNKKYTDKILNRILLESGGQFPVMGIVYEDMVAGRFYPYPFKDGVTVHAVTIKDSLATQEQVDYCLTLTNDRIRSKTYGRIASTVREEYKKAGGMDDVGTTDHPKITWLATVRDLYKKALTSDNNELITDWAKANL